MLFAVLWGKVLWVGLTAKEYVELILSVLIAIVPALYLLIADRKKLFSLYESYQFFSSLPLGVGLFSAIVGAYAPYSASVSPTVRSLKMTDKDITCVSTFEDRPWLRNPFQSVHAVALTNIGECASGVAIVAVLQDKRFRDIKGIPIRIDTEYFKKGRGRMTATATINFVDLKEGKSRFETCITDDKGEHIATCFVTWSFRDKSGATSGDNSKKEK